ncbi:uncharacterized protein LOC130049741 [Ostrea edulis]|uniref:uncharacterized protein LOC130049741 n=1 Tax=Ostrea edulis TaxID=37623 RepID=UPI0024AFCA84|nr:uncharacterized protein LOC130049741 [Ostrea edulis]
MKPEQILQRLYYDPKTGYGGVLALYRRVRQLGHKITLSQIREWVKAQDTYTLHKPIRRKFKRRQTRVTDMDEQWQLDLADVSSLKQDNNGYTFLLCAIDVLSKYAWVVPLKQKTGKEMIRGLRRIFREGRRPVRIQSDQGKEFTNKEFRQAFKSIHFFTTRNAETKAISGELLLVNAKNVLTVWKTLYGKQSADTTSRLQVGDRVRISKAKRTFEKEYLPNWTKELFTISRKVPGRNVYRIQDDHGEELEGTFYEKELQQVIKDDDVYEVEEILGYKKRRVGKKVISEVKVRWKGYPPSFGSWIPQADLILP